MDVKIEKLFSEMIINETQSYQNMTVIPFSYKQKMKLKYVILDKALKENHVEIKEISESGSVPELLVDNPSDNRVLLVDGEELVGAKQNRVLNATILLDKKSKTTIPVSCVEQSRWSYREKNFSSSGSSMPSYSRSAKMSSVSRSLSMTKGKRYDSDQGEVWQEVDRVSSSARVHSPTRAISDVYEGRKADIEEYLSNIKKSEKQNGFFIFINEKPAGMEFISDVNAFSELHDKLLKGYAMEALIESQNLSGADFSKLTHDFIASVKTSEEKVYKSVGIGNDHRFESEIISGSALIAEDEIVHFSALSRKGKDDQYRTGNFIRRIMR